MKKKPKRKPREWEVCILCYPDLFGFYNHRTLCCTHESGSPKDKLVRVREVMRRGK